MMNLHKVLAIKQFQITHQIHEGFASFVMSFSSRSLQIFSMLNSRFYVQAKMRIVGLFKTIVKFPC